MLHFSGCLSQGLDKYSPGFINEARRTSVAMVTVSDVGDLSCLVPPYQGETLHLRRHRPGGLVGVLVIVLANLANP